MAETLGIGIVGASPERGWAKISHIPAIQTLDGMRLAAVLGSTPASAEAAAIAFEAEHAYADPVEFFSDPAVDVVVVAVRVPLHRELVLGALRAGKHVYCEWPLGRDLAEAEELANAARKAGRITVIGLQARCSPALQRAADLIRSGAIGRVFGARMTSETVAFGPSTAKAERYLEDRANGATLVTIHAGHALDAAIAVLGPISDLQGLATRQFLEVAVMGERERITRTVSDLVLMQAMLSGGAALSCEVAGGRTKDPEFCFEIVGEAGRLRLAAAAPRGFQSGRLSLTMNGEPESVDEGELAGLPDEAVNVGAIYAALRDDVRQGARSLAGFEHAVRLTRLLADFEAASENGMRYLAEDWPDA
jgi:predicted dehydrogenase